MENKSPLNEEELANLELAAAKATQLLGWLGPLCDDPNFQRFLNFLKEGVDANTTLAVDVTKTPIERNDYVQRRLAISAMHDWPTQTRKACIETIQKAAAARTEAVETKHRIREEAQNGIPGSSPFEKGSQVTT